MYKLPIVPLNDTWTKRKWTLCAHASMGPSLPSEDAQRTALRRRINTELPTFTRAKSVYTFVTPKLLRCIHLAKHTWKCVDLCMSHMQIYARSRTAKRVVSHGVWWLCAQVKRAIQRTRNTQKDNGLCTSNGSLKMLMLVGWMMMLAWKMHSQRVRIKRWMREVVYVCKNIFIAAMRKICMTLKH